jgi:uncharacterized protein YlaI
MILYKYSCDRCEARINDGMFLIDRKAQKTPDVEHATKYNWFDGPVLYSDGIQLAKTDSSESSFHICKECNDRLTKFMEPNVK